MASMNKIIREVNLKPYKLESIVSERDLRFFVMTGLIILLKAMKGSPMRSQWNSVITSQNPLKSRMSHSA